MIFTGETLPFRAAAWSRRCWRAKLAGGDKRGKQSAALLIYGEEEWSDLDLRVDDHVEPLVELERLERVSRERWLSFRRFLPGRRHRWVYGTRTIMEKEIARELAGEGQQ